MFVNYWLFTSLECEWELRKTENCTYDVTSCAHSGCGWVWAERDFTVCTAHDVHRMSHCPHTSPEKMLVKRTDFVGHKGFWDRQNLWDTLDLWDTPDSWDTLVSWDILDSWDMLVLWDMLDSWDILDSWDKLGSWDTLDLWDTLEWWDMSIWGQLVAVTCRHADHWCSGHPLGSVG